MNGFAKLLKAALPSVRTPAQIAGGTEPFGLGRLKGWHAYLFAAIATGTTLAVRLALDRPFEGRPALVLFTLSIMVSAYVGGLRAGLLATALSYFASSYYLLPPIHSFQVASGGTQWQQLCMVLSGVVISALNEALHRTRRLATRTLVENKKAEEALHKAGALQTAIFSSANFSSIATDEKGVIQIFNVGAERMLGYTAAEVMNKVTPAEISDPQEVIARAKALGDRRCLRIDLHSQGRQPVSSGRVGHSAA